MTACVYRFTELDSKSVVLAVEAKNLYKWCIFSNSVMKTGKFLV